MRSFLKTFAVAILLTSGLTLAAPAKAMPIAPLHAAATDGAVTKVLYGWGCGWRGFCGRPFYGGYRYRPYWAAYAYAPYWGGYYRRWGYRPWGYRPWGYWGGYRAWGYRPWGYRWGYRPWGPRWGYGGWGHRWGGYRRLGWRRW